MFMNEAMSPPLSYTGNKRHEPNQKFVSVEKIIKVITDHYGIPMASLIIRCRKREIVNCRQVMMWFLTKYTQLSLKSIGEMFGDKDHTTVIHSCQTIDDRIDSDDRVYYEIEELTSKLLEMNVKISSEENLVEIAQKAIHHLNNLLVAIDRYYEQPGNDSRTAKRRWEDKSRAFLSEISGQEVKHNEEIVKISLTQE